MRRGVGKGVVVEGRKSREGRGNMRHWHSTVSIMYTVCVRTIIHVVSCVLPVARVFSKRLGSLAFLY